MQRREFATLLVRATGLAGLALAACERTADILTPLQSPPEPKVITAQAFGAKGDGSTDDTRSIQSAIDSLYGADGVVLIPDGIYMIDADRSLTLMSGVTLRLSPGATLRAFANDSQRYAVLRAIGQKRITIEGGTIEGERLAHRGVGGEWGHGIDVRSCEGVTIRNVTVRSCWGDGIYIGGTLALPCTDIVVDTCTVEYNRRQAISIVACTGALIQNCNLSHTQGTAPEAGIDLEPNVNAVVRNVHVKDCSIFGNAGCGVQLYGANVTDNVVENNDCRENGAAGIWISGAQRNQVATNKCRLNGQHGIVLGELAAHNVLIANACDGNGQSRIGPFNNIHVGTGASRNIVTTNICRQQGGVVLPRFGVRIDAPNCSSNWVIQNDLRTGGTLADFSDDGTATVFV